jgi:hypothetical protein
MPSKRLSLPLASLAVVGAAVVLLLALQSHATANGHMNYAHLNKIQKRNISGTLASALAQSQATPNSLGGDDNGTGADGLPDAPPKSFGAPGAAGSPGTYFPSGNGGACPASHGSNIKVNQNCLNVANGSLQGRSQANNEESIAVDPMNPSHLVASDNNYIRGDGTCGAYFSLNGGRNWNDVTTPNGFTTGPSGGAPRQYWQAGGDTSVAWDTRGNSYLSCQLFNRGSGTSQNPDQSSAFVVFRSTGNNGASFNFPGRYSIVFFDPTGTSGVLEDKALMTIDDNTSSPYRDRIYVTWTNYAADGSAYIYEVHSDDYGESFSSPVLVSANSTDCTNPIGGAPNGNCNQNQFSDPFVGPDGDLYVAFDNFNVPMPINGGTSPADNHFQVLLAKSADGGQSFSAPVKVSNYYDLPDCDTYQGAGADPFRSCVPEKGSSTKSVFRATNYPSGQVDPRNPNRVEVTFGSYVNQDSNESNGCTPTGFAPNLDPLYTGVKTAGACNNKILVSVSKDGGSTFTGTTTDPRQQTMVTQGRRQNGTDQFWQWSAFTRSGKLAVDYYDRQYGNDETTGSSDFSLSGSNDLVHFGQARVSTSSMPAPTQFGDANGGLFMGDYVGLSAFDNAYPIWSDTRSKDLFLCPGTGTAGHPPQLCGGVEPNGQTANDEDTSMATMPVPLPGGGQNSQH